MAGSACYKSNVIYGVTATISSVADRWVARLTANQEHFAQEFFLLCEFKGAVNFCNSELISHFENSLPWEESTVESADGVYHEWNYFSAKKKSHYKIFRKDGAGTDYKCLILTFKQDTLSEVCDYVSYPELIGAKNYFFELENS